jgi:divalent metal cation (Fe/Co/Zn/Cd) transporter
VSLAALTTGWNILEGLLAVGLGLRAGSIALIGFGVDSFIETTSGALLWWRLRHELRGTWPGGAERLEKTTARAAGILLLALSIYLTIESTRRLLGAGPEPDSSPLGIALTCVSLVVMPALGRAKLRVAAGLRSGAMRADAFETLACAWLSLATLAGLGLNAALGWWWADPAAGLVLVPLIAREGWQGLVGGRD